MIGVDDWPLPALVALFLVSGILVWLAGTRLAIYGDEIADRFQLAKEFVGLIFLAAVTELPEIVTTITAAQIDNPALVLGNMFGGITMQTAVLAVADIFAVRFALTSWPRNPTLALVAVMLIILLSSLLAITLSGDATLVLHVGIGAVVISAAYVVVLVILRRLDRHSSWVPVDLPPEIEESLQDPYEHLRTRDRSSANLIVLLAVCSLVILVAGVALALSADAIAKNTALGSSFIGVTLLAAATSMPELSTTLAAARIGAYTMAISNIFGSNLIMTALLLPADLAYTNGPILSEADLSAKLSLATGILVTAIYVAGILVRRTPRYLGAGLDSWLVLAVYLATIVALYFIQ